MTIGERELIERSLRGEEEAFSQLLEANQGEVYRHCLSIVKDTQNAQDLTQEAFVQAYRHLSSFRREARFSTWVWRIAHNLSLNFLKKQHGVMGEFNEEVLPKQKKEAPPIDEELLSSIYQALEKLPEKQGRVFDLFVLQHIPQKEIAALLGISPGTVRSRLFYARKKIKQFLGEVSDKNLPAEGK